MDSPDTAPEDEDEDEVLEDDEEDEEVVATATAALVEIAGIATEVVDEALGFFAGHAMAVQMADRARNVVGNFILFKEGI